MAKRGEQKGHKVAPLNKVKAGIQKSIANQYARIAMPGIPNALGDYAVECRIRHSIKASERKTGKAGTPRDLVRCYVCGQAFPATPAGKLNSELMGTTVVHTCVKGKGHRKPRRVERYNGVRIEIPAAVRNTLPKAHSRERIDAMRGGVTREDA